MTRTPTNLSALRRLAFGIAGATVALGVAVAPSITASATTMATSSGAVADEANHALWLLVNWQRTADVADYTTFLDARAIVAKRVAADLGVDGAELESEWAAVSVEKQHVILSAMAQLGVPYRSRMSRANRGFDCSGLVLYAYAQAGIELPRTSRDQIRSAAAVTEADLEPGDLVYYPGHISLYIGDGLIVHSPQSGQDVEVRPMFDRSLRFGDAIVTHAG